ncbi:hypothetical protein ASPZODRAFT_13665 [Penicilliopsis zonata CBS 506.65]|uniref:HPP transmembrane region domain-containing protein n=1 Tax=Penicilliopsis zonata CBS 506.65 TaxID=1073090 RepID=A0A1L9SP98_9EURO|nr:hypothetical protein ASPZODRAFT_13665 [Penicilliopsis zonata CBS 506.65]OJJ48931.1 hypothetical protein ASPZODRAFT_13665 [Penicilliopsis zonata CBS 506.65]
MGQQHTWHTPTRWHLDIDHYLNPWLPAPPWRHLPRLVSRMFGYREHPTSVMGNVGVAFWALIGIFCGVAVVATVSMHIPSFEEHGAPIIVASLGAAAVLQFCAIESPLAQPRNAVLGQLIASVVGAGMSKLFALNPSAQALRQLGGALSCAIATALMTLTHTVHPPAGATALLAVTQSPELGWFLIPVMMLGSTLMLAVALLINNIQRRYPLYWWTAHSLRREPAGSSDEEKGAAAAAKRADSLPSQYEESLTDDPPHISIRRGELFVPESIVLTHKEREVLERLSSRI